MSILLTSKKYLYTFICTTTEYRTRPGTRGGPTPDRVNERVPCAHHRLVHGPVRLFCTLRNSERARPANPLGSQQVQSCSPTSKSRRGPGGQAAVRRSAEALPDRILFGNGVVRRGLACEWECGSHPSPLQPVATHVGALHERSTGSTAIKYD